MTYHAAVPIGYNEGTNITLDSEQAVDQLIVLLARPETGDITIQGDDGESAVLDVHVSHGFGYLSYYGPQLCGRSVGDPASPALAEESEARWPVGSGVSLPTFRATLMEFIRSEGQLPQVVQWQPEV